MRGAALLPAALSLAACTVGPDYRRPEVSTPPAFRGAGPGEAAEPGSTGDLAWWRVFEDETLQELIRTALAENRDVRIAAARIVDARTQVTVTRSFQLPEVGVSADAPYTRTEGDLAPTQQRETWSPLAGLTLFFELDFWGRWRRATEAARAELVASEEARRVVVVALVSDVAAAYLQLRALDLELEVARQTLDARENSLRLVRLRQEGGVAGLIDVRQAEILVNTAAEAIPETLRRLEQTENVISVLLGRYPEAVRRGRALGQQLALPPAPAGLPSALLERRPDIRQAERQLAAATARVGVATADFFPRVFLSGAAGAGGVAVNGSVFGPQGIFSLLPQVTLPVFTAGRVAAGVESADARAHAALLVYEQTVLQAFREVSDALVEYRRRQESRVQREALAVAARDTTRLANIRYRGGVTSYLEVLDSERQSFDAELGAIRARRDEFQAVVQLYRALGGGWQE